MESQPELGLLPEWWPGDNLGDCSGSDPIGQTLTRCIPVRASKFVVDNVIRVTNADKHFAFP